MLATTPVKTYNFPSYPTKLDAIENEHLLEKCQPTRWKKVAVIASCSFFFFGVGLADSASKTTEKSPKMAVVAPLFEHGKGTGSFGCIVVAPPVYFSEEEGLKMIKKILEKKGLSFTRTDVKLETVKIPTPFDLLLFEDLKQMIPEEDIKKENIQVHADPFSVDLFDDNKKIAVEFLSRQDESELNADGGWCSVQTHKMKPTANKVLKNVKEKGEEYYFGLFYDPLVMPKKTIRT